VNTNVYSLQTNDFIEMRDALDGWDQEYRQICPGSFHGSILHSQAGSTGIFHNRWERAIQYRGTPPKGTVAVAVTLTQTAKPRWNGQTMVRDDVLLQSSGTEAEYLSAPTWDSVVFAIPEARLAQMIADLDRDDPETFLGEHGIYRLRPNIAVQVRQGCVNYLNVVTQAVKQPADIERLPCMVEHMEELIARALVSSRPRHSHHPGLSRQIALVRKARDYFEHFPDRPIRIAPLCHEFGVSERTLHSAFCHQVGTSPVAFLRTQRLNRVHQQLMGADPANTLIKQVAYDHGFRHLGRFSRVYKNLFGESPSETLRLCKNNSKLVC